MFYTENILPILLIINISNMVKRQNDQKESRNIVLKAETYDKLDKYTAKLIGRKGTTHISFDDAINELLKNEVG